MGIFSSPCPFPYGESPYGNGEGSFDAPLSHARVTQILEFWAIQRARDRTQTQMRTAAHRKQVTKQRAGHQNFLQPTISRPRIMRTKGKGGFSSNRTPTRPLIKNFARHFAQALIKCQHEKLSKKICVRLPKAPSSDGIPNHTIPQHNNQQIPILQSNSAIPIWKQGPKIIHQLP